MQAVILAGGKGTRLHPYTFSVPKPLLPLDTVPMLVVVLRQLAACGFGRITICTGHLGYLFAPIIGNGNGHGVEVTYVNEPAPLGTAGPLRQLADLEDDFLVMNGDILTDLDFGAFMHAHARSGAAASIALSARQVHIDYGVIEANEKDLLDRYLEKPVIPYTVSMGIYALQRRSLEYVPDDAPFDIPDLMTTLQHEGESVYCHRNTAYWQDIGRVDDYEQATLDFRAHPERFGMSL